MPAEDLKLIDATGVRSFGAELWGNGLFDEEGVAQFDWLIRIRCDGSVALSEGVCVMTDG